MYCKRIRNLVISFKNYKTTQNDVEVGKSFSASFNIARVFKQSDLLACGHFNSLVEIVLRKVVVNRNATIFTKEKKEYVQNLSIIIEKNRANVKI